MTEAATFFSQFPLYTLPTSFSTSSLPILPPPSQFITVLYQLHTYM